MSDHASWKTCDGQKPCAVVATVRTLVGDRESDLRVHAAIERIPGLVGDRSRPADKEPILSEWKWCTVVDGDGRGEWSVASIVGISNGSGWDLNVITGESSFAGSGVIDAVRPSLDKQIICCIGDIVCAYAAAGVVGVAVERNRQAGKLSCV